MSEPVVLGLGGNIGSDAEIVARFGHARAALAELGPVRSARLYRSAPIVGSQVGAPGPAQPAFLNTAVEVALADAQPAELIAILLELERQLGRAREREVRWGPRTIDLDVLVWGSRTVDTPALSVPHPRLAERKFALSPLVDLVGDSFVVPGYGPAGALLRRVAAQGCDVLAATW